MSGSKIPFGMIIVGDSPTIVMDQILYRELVERCEMVAEGRLPGSSKLPFAVELEVQMVEIVDWVDDQARIRHFDLLPALTRAIADTVTGRHELWFCPDTGEARVSVETDHERVMLRLALEGGVA